MSLRWFRMMFGLQGSVKNAKPIEGITDFLTNNESFKNGAMKFHNTKTNMWANLDRMLEDELLPEEARKRKKEISTKEDNDRNHKY